jgi:hypothetical protein
MVADLQKERDRITRAIAALTGTYSPSAAKKTKAAATRPSAMKRKKRGLTPAGRRRLSLMMKKRWAERRKKGLKNLG